MQNVVTFKSFQVFKPPKFQRTIDLVEARTWLKKIGKAFALVKVGEDQKIEYASYFLKGEANY